MLKLGGELLESAEDVARMAKGIAALAGVAQLTVVHGGGREIDAALAAAGIPKRQVDGLRVTDEATLDVVVGVLAGSINTRLVAGVRRAGGRPVGLTGRRRAGGGDEARGADRQHAGRHGGPRPGRNASRAVPARRCWPT